MHSVFQQLRSIHVIKYVDALSLNYEPHNLQARNEISNEQRTLQLGPDSGQSSR